MCFFSGGFNTVYNNNLLKLLFFFLFFKRLFGCRRTEFQKFKNFKVLKADVGVDIFVEVLKEEHSTG